MNTHIIIKPVLKTFLSKSPIKVFYVARTANKQQIEDALYSLFEDIQILRINTVNLPAKKVACRGKRSLRGAMGLRQARKKAYVKLAPGYSINFSDKAS
jgi:ribosomal protein L23